MGEIVIGGRFAVLPTRAIADTQLSRRDVFVLAVLSTLEDGTAVKRREGWFQVSQGIVARLCGSPRSCVNESIKRLVGTGYLEKRSLVNALGGTNPCEYRIVQDGALDPTFDRWRHMPSDGRLDTRVETPGNQGVVPDDRGVAQADTGPKPPEIKVSSQTTGGVVPGDRGVAQADTGPKNQAGQGVANRDTPVGDSTIDSSNKSNRDSTRTSNTELFLDGRSNVDFDNVETVVNGFLQLRGIHFPNASTGHSDHGKLFDQAADFLARGISVESLLSTLNARMQNHADRGQEAPAGLTRFRQDILTAGKMEQAIGRAPYRRQSAAGSARTGAELDRGAVVDAADPVPAEKWTEAIGRIAAADKAGIAKAWLTSAVVVVRDGRAVIRLPSVMARDQVREAVTVVEDVCRDVLGVAGVEIVHAGAGRRVERRTGGA